MAAHGLTGQLAASVYEIIKVIATEQRGYWICTLFFFFFAASAGERFSPNRFKIRENESSVSVTRRWQFRRSGGVMKDVLILSMMAKIQCFEVSRF